jgi:hypothetical protein
MTCFIEVTYISPISSYRFNKSDKYFLTFVAASTSTSPSTKLAAINKIVLGEINNITDSLRGIVVKKTIKMINNQYPNFKINLFKYNSTTNIIQLLFTGDIVIDDYEFGQKSNVILHGVENIKSTTYTSESDLLDEKFFNLEYVEDENKCLVFFSKLFKPNNLIPIIKPTILDVTKLTKTDIYSYDRNSHCIIKEYIPTYIKNLLNTTNVAQIQNLHNTRFVNDICLPNNFKKYVDLYNADVTIYDGSFNKIKQNDLVKLRPIRYDPYINNFIIVPADSRVRGFQINDSVKFLLNGTEYKINNLVDIHTLNGINQDPSGIFCRMCPQDYQRVYTPYSGYLKDVRVDKSYILFKFESNYFIPKDVGERNYMAVIYGNYMYGGTGVGMAMREAPELLDEQPNTKLVFYVIMIGYGIKLINKKLVNQQVIKLLEGEQTWFEQGEELGLFKCCGGSVICLFNRTVDFTADIKQYSIIENNKQMDTLIKARDVLGMLT